ncbi:lamin tail domain-containing protein [Lewinella sp. IMCC34183]|uniref:lamin tail domain-containing protein n=1 Tax=Lewinella sp. IMCC34183 TaxID=2248762 RepID=UPI00130034D1
MPDPNPPVGLPEAEYIELYNPGPTAISLEGVAVASGGRAVAAGAGFPPLDPDEYVVLVREPFVDGFASLGIRVLPLALPTLSNAGDAITLLLDGDTLVHLTYTAEWYHDPARDGGGYSLEYTGSGDPACGGNWRASPAPAGGTPGRPNAAYGMRADTLPPRLLNATLTESGAKIRFDETLVAPPFFSLDDRLVSANPVGDRDYFVPFAPVRGTVYALTILADYGDCAGNFAERDTILPLLLADPPGPGEVYISELLFDPVAGGSDFVELYNPGPGAYALTGLTVSNPKSSSRPVILTTGRFIAAEEYLVLTPDPDYVRRSYPGVDPERLVTTDLPALPNESGAIELLAPDGTLIDAVDYTATDHSPLLRSVEGVTLEREPGGDWSSAAAAAGYGTPTQPNSQSAGGGSTSTVVLTAQETVFTPDGDGYQDNYLIDYREAPAGSLARLLVYDLDGRRVADTPAADLLARSGQLSWDGSDATGVPVVPGPYVVLVEVFTPDGLSESFKLVAVVAGAR